MKTSKEIVAEILSHISKRGGEHREWYVGIAENARKRLFEDHGVVEKIDKWIFRECKNSEAARTIENYLLEKYEFKGGTGGGSDMTKYVYAYKIASHTEE